MSPLRAEPRAPATGPAACPRGHRDPSLHRGSRPRWRRSRRPTTGRPQDPGCPGRGRGVVRVGRHRAEDRVRPDLPAAGIWPSLHLDTAITLPVGVEAYAAFALRAWLDRSISDQTRGFAKWSAICSFALGMAGQVAYHLMAQAGMARAPWPVTTIVSCLPVLVLAMGTTLAHMLRADAAAERLPLGREDQIRPRSSARFGGNQDGPHADQDRGAGGRPRSSPPVRPRVAAPGAGTSTG